MFISNNKIIYYLEQISSLLQNLHKNLQQQMNLKSTKILSQIIPSNITLANNLCQYVNQVVSTHKQPIRSYVRVFPSMGLDPILDNQYQILDGKTILNKRDNKKFAMHTFNYVFTNQFLYANQIQHMNIIDDCLQGKNQLIIANIDKQFFEHFLIGSAEDPGFLISVFHGLFNQVCFTSEPDREKPQKNKNIKQTSDKKNKQQNISISIFSSQDNSNKFIDLIVGQRFIFYSKKDMDQYKDFYDKNIETMRQFLIVLKIALIHYKQCCKQGDPIVFRIKADFYDQLKNLHYSSTLHIIFCQRNSKVTSNIGKKIQFSLSNSLLKGEDHGSLANYLEKFIRKSKLIYIYGVPYRKSILSESIPILNFLTQLRNHSFQFPTSKVDMKTEQKISNINSFSLLNYKCCSSNFNHKQISMGIQLLERICDFLDEAKTKWKNYCQIFNEVLQVRRQFYEKQRFPISIQIQEYNVKSFIISKIYRLSQTYQMEDLSLQMQKLRTIKNQISIAFKAIQNSKQIVSLSTNKNAEEFLRYYQKCVAEIWDNMKIMFGISYRCVQIYNIQLYKHINIQVVMDSKILKQLILKFKNQAKKIKHKQQILIRKIDRNQNIMQSINNCSQLIQVRQLSQSKSYIPKFDLDSKDHSKKQVKKQIKSVQTSYRQSLLDNKSNQNLRGTEIFQLFKKERRLKNKSELGQQIKNSSEFKQMAKLSPLCIVRVNNNIPKSKENIVKHLRDNKQSSVTQNSSIIITKQYDRENYNFSLPKIAIIHRKTKR